jgi:hypothetical protein
MPATNTHDDQVPKVETLYHVRITKVDRNVSFRDREYKKIGVNNDGEDEYGYVYFDNTKTVETDVYEQKVEDIDVTAVIKAVNGMDE